MRLEPLSTTLPAVRLGWAPWPHVAPSLRAPSQCAHRVEAGSQSQDLGRELKLEVQGPGLAWDT